MRRQVNAILMAVLWLVPLPVAGPLPRAGLVSGDVAVQDAGLFGDKPRQDRSGVVVFLEGVPGPPPPPLSPPPALRQREKAFLPAVLAVPRGTTVTFPNEDRIFHNVFSVSRPATFDLGLYKAGTGRSVVFDRPGVVDIYCNIHPEMVASIRVLDTAYYAMTGPRGEFRIPRVPPGTYGVVAWLPRAPEVRGQVTVPPGGTATLHLSLRAGPAGAHHLRKDGTPYGRYE